MKYLYMPLSWMVLFTARLVMILLGFAAVTLALPQRKKVGAQVAFTQYPGSWQMIKLPAWALMWDNLRDGAMGDKRGWYWMEGYPKFAEKSATLKMWWWLAVRNPANTFSRFTRGVGCPVDQCKITLLAGQEYVRDKVGNEGWQLVEAQGPRFKYWGFYGVWRYGSSDTACVVRLGHKIEPRHATTDFSNEPTKAWKGITFRFSLYKDIA